MKQTRLPDTDSNPAASPRSG